MMSRLGPDPFAPEEYWQGGLEPLALFEINIGDTFSPPAIYFKGASNVGPFTHKASHINETTRSPDSRPIAAGEIGAPAANYTAFGIPPDLETFSINRLNDLLVDYAGLPAGPSVQRRNLVRRIGHLLGGLRFRQPQTPPRSRMCKVKRWRQMSSPYGWVPRQMPG